MDRVINTKTTIDVADALLEEARVVAAFEEGRRLLWVEFF
jgi:hypothetical protein